MKTLIFKTEVELIDSSKPFELHPTDVELNVHEMYIREVPPEDEEDEPTQEEVVDVDVFLRAWFEGGKMTYEKRHTFTQQMLDSVIGYDSIKRVETINWQALQPIFQQFNLTIKVTN